VRFVRALYVAYLLVIGLGILYCTLLGVLGR
jgi:hypothetical protein